MTWALFSDATTYYASTTLQSSSGARLMVSAMVFIGSKVASSSLSGILVGPLQAI